MIGYKHSKLALLLAGYLANRNLYWAEAYGDFPYDTDLMAECL